MLAKISSVACAALMLCASIPTLDAAASPMRRAARTTAAPIVTPAVAPVTVINQVAAPINVNVQNNIAVGVGAPATVNAGNLNNNSSIGQTATVPATRSGLNYTSQSVVPINVNLQNNLSYGVAGGMGKINAGNLGNTSGVGQTVKK